MMFRFTVRGAALLSHGFRVFFLLALIFAALIMPYWIAVFFGLIGFSGHLKPIDWHIHEMIFGYGAAVIAGFLFTAIPNWTGRLPIRGWPLAVLAVVWLAGRIALLGVGDLGPFTVMGFDCAFLLAVTGAALAEVIAGRNWRNLLVLLPVLTLLGANALFHIEIITNGSADMGSRLGLVTIIFLITLIGGRIIPSFTRNWLVKRGQTSLPTPFNRFDAICIVLGGVSFVVWVVFPSTLISRALLSGVAIMHGFRLLRWSGVQTTASPLLFSLHVAYGFVPIGLLALGFGFETAGVHLLGIGAIGGMTVAVMIRASAGHTGRALNMGHGPFAGFVLILVASLARALAPMAGAIYQPVLLIAGGLWTMGFMLVLWGIGPWLWSATLRKREANSH